MAPLYGAASRVGTMPRLVCTPQASAQTLPWLSEMFPAAPAAPLRYQVAAPALFVFGPRTVVQFVAGTDGVVQVTPPPVFQQPQAVTYCLSSAESWAMPWS